jgi:hypothetical protein
MDLTCDFWAENGKRKNRAMANIMESVISGLMGC